MRHLKVNSQKAPAGRRTIGTRNSKEIASKSVQNDRNNIGEYGVDLLKNKLTKANISFVTARHPLIKARELVPERCHERGEVQHKQIRPVQGRQP